jgi:hypothetical protein
MSGPLKSAGPGIKFNSLVGKKFPDKNLALWRSVANTLVGPVTIEVELKIKDKWRTVCTETLQFGSHPFHLRPLMGPVMSIPVDTTRSGG